MEVKLGMVIEDGREAIERWLILLGGAGFG